MRRTSVTVVAILAAVTLAATSIAPLDLSALPGQSTLIVTGYVLNTRTTRNDSVFEKLSVVRVVSVLRGTAPKPPLHIRTRTGLVFFDRHLEPGDSGVFFLRPSENGTFEAAYPGSFALFQQGWVKRP